MSESNHSSPSSHSSSPRFQCDFTWTIQDFEKNADHDERYDEYMKSPNFSAANDDVEWFLVLRTDNNHSEVLLFLEHDELKEHCPIMGKFEYSFINPEGRKVNKNPIFFCIHCKMYRFIRIDNFPPCEYSLHNMKCNNGDRWRIFCRLSYVREAKENLFLIDQPHTIKENFETFLNNEEFSDVAIYVGDKMFPCHKIILATRSSVFKSMLALDMKEKVSNRIDIRDFNENIIREALRYIYTGKVEISEATLMDLLRVADKYDLADLKTLCENELGTTLTRVNAVEIISVSKTYNLENLKAQAVEFIATNLKGILDSDVWNDLKSHPDVLKLLLKKLLK